MKKLHNGATIGIIAPASMLDSDKLSIAVSFLENRGYRTKLFGLDENITKRTKESDGLRASIIEKAFLDKDVDGIISLRGGYGSNRIADLLDYEMISKNKKIFVGFSDITNLLFSLHYKSNMTSFHGPMLADLSGKRDETSIKTLFDMLEGKSVEYSMPIKEHSYFNEGVSEGTIIGGNLTILSSLVGTPTFNVPPNSILFFEDINEFMYELDRLLVHLRRANVFHNVSGIIIGETPVKDPGENNSLGSSFEDMLLDHFQDFDGPIITEFPCGHTFNQLTIPFGSKTYFTVNSNSFTIKFDIPFFEN